MFATLLNQWGIPAYEAHSLVYYLKRHIDLDGDHHGPAAKKMLEKLIGDDQTRYNKALKSAQQAIRARIQLWDGVLNEFDKNKTCA
jgi:hypothetical protein